MQQSCNLPTENSPEEQSNVSTINNLIEDQTSQQHTDVKSTTTQMISSNVKSNRRESIKETSFNHIILYFSKVNPAKVLNHSPNDLNGHE